MDTIQWLEQYSVNHNVIDSQHKKLVEMINAMISHEHVNVDSEIVSDMLSNMTEYACFHFKTEEAYMEEIGFPDSKSHKEKHRLFRLKVVQFCTETMAHNPSIPQDIIQFLSQWLIHHILHVDMKYKVFCENKEPQTSLKSSM